MGLRVPMLFCCWLSAQQKDAPGGNRCLRAFDQEACTGHPRWFAGGAFREAKSARKLSAAW